MSLNARYPLNIVFTASVSAKKILFLKVEIIRFYLNNFLCGKGNLCAHRVKHGQVFNLLVVMFSSH